MLSKCFQERFALMPRPKDLSTDEARQLVIDAYRLLISNRLEVAGVDVQVGDATETAENELAILRRLADYLSAFTAIFADLSQTQIPLPTVSSANFVAAQVFEFLAEYQATGSEALEQKADDTEPLAFNGFEFWTFRNQTQLGTSCKPNWCRSGIGMRDAANGAECPIVEP